MRIDVDFVLSPLDLASGTSLYVMQQRPVPVESMTSSRINEIMPPQQITDRAVPSAPPGKLRRWSDRRGPGRISYTLGSPHK